MESMASESTRAKTAMALKLLLERAEADPKEFVDHPLAQCLLSQSALASYESAEEEIYACSLNTFKRACIEVPGGFKAINALRLRLQEKIELARSSAPPKTTKRSLQSKSDYLTKELSLADGDLLVLTKMLEIALRNGRQYAIESRNPSIIERCRREQDEIRDMMTMTQTSSKRLTLVRT
jgi:hypothetical protein